MRQHSTPSPHNQTSEIVMTELNKWDERYGEAGFAYGTEREREIHEGRLHTGLCAVVQLMAIKR